MLDIVAVILVLAAAAAWLNRRFFRLPPTIGVMAIALAASLAIVACAADPADVATAKKRVEAVGGGGIKITSVGGACMRNLLHRTAPHLGNLRCNQGHE
jgi:hypothetical protein